MGYILGQLASFIVGECDTVNIYLFSDNDDLIIVSSKFTIRTKTRRVLQKALATRFDYRRSRCS